jgi:triacylglycerol lipase
VTWQLIKDLIQFIPVRSIPQDWTEPRELNPDRPIVILISGFGASPNVLRIMRKRLIRDGFNVIIQTLSLQMLAGSVEGLSWLSRRLRDLVSELRANPKNQNQKIFIVAHSAGGLVARHYIQTLGGHKHTQGLVTLATPHQGLWLASLGFFTHLVVKARCLYDILPISGFLRGLNQSEFPENFPMVSIYSTQDVLCPVETTRLPVKMLQRGGVTEKALTELNHMEFLFQKKAYAFLRQWFDLQGAKNETKNLKKQKAMS